MKKVACAPAFRSTALIALVSVTLLFPFPHRLPELLLNANLRLWQTNIDTLTSQLGLTVPTARRVMVSFPALLFMEAQVRSRVMC